MTKRPLIIFCLLAMFVAPVARANVLVTDLSKDQISIRGDFAGETLLLFGAIDPNPHGAIDGVVVVLRGPGENIMLRKKRKTLGIWVNQTAYPMGPLPGFLATVSSAPLADFIPDEERRLLNIGADKLQANMLSGTPSDEEQRAALAAFIRLKQKDRLFAENAQAVEIIDDRLFRAEINLPAGMPVGRYVTEFFAFKNGRVVGYRTGELPVDIVGAGHILGEAAHKQSLLYGLSGVALAVFMGWGVAAIFRRR
ncbi:MAG: TIGR02186 family protein [Alphaproteobacteria bacterium]|nr:TIGR02186 family protein [Alphaproteobacteria bacterium]